MKLLLMSDIHGNQNALQSVLAYIKQEIRVDACILLGDLIDYGMHSNEVVKLIHELPYPILCNIRGNHEQAVIMEDYEKFSSDRGRLCARYTKSILTKETWNYITNDMVDGKMEFVVDGKKCLAIHGSLKDEYWKNIYLKQDFIEYKSYDYVFSGHSHLPHFIEIFYEVDRPECRNKRKTIFINPGSVGQPRNLNPMAQFAILDTQTEEISMKKVSYDIKKEQKAYRGQVDDFYRKRLEMGI